MVIPNRKEAIRYAIEHAQEGDMITILGLGHESYQEENALRHRTVIFNLRHSAVRSVIRRGKAVISRMATKHLREEEEWIDKR